MQDITAVTGLTELSQDDIGRLLSLLSELCPGSMGPNGLPLDDPSRVVEYASALRGAPSRSHMVRYRKEEGFMWYLTASPMGSQRVCVAQARDLLDAFRNRV